MNSFVGSFIVCSPFFSLLTGGSVSVQVNRVNNMLIPILFPIINTILAHSKPNEKKKLLMYPRGATYTVSELQKSRKIICPCFAIMASGSIFGTSYSQYSDPCCSSNALLLLKSDGM